MAHDLVVPQIHIYSQFIVDPFYTEGGHVAYDTLHRSGGIEL